MIQAGAKPITWMALLCEWTPDYTSPERARLNDVVLQARVAVEQLNRDAGYDPVFAIREGMGPFLYRMASPEQL